MDCFNLISICGPARFLSSISAFLNHLLTVGPLETRHVEVLHVGFEGMSRSMRIQDLLSPSVATADGEHSQIRNSGLPPKSGYKRSTPSNSEKRKPIIHAQSKQPVLNLLTWDLPLDEGPVVTRKKRKLSPEDAVLLRNPRRLPRYSVNIFNAEPTNVYPIPYQGIVPRMIKYCK